MVRKPKFRPVITRVKLNPEQAVLSCMCFYGAGAGHPFTNSWPAFTIIVCGGNRTGGTAPMCNTVSAPLTGYTQSGIAPTASS